MIKMIVGLVGCPNSGKSTMFKALTMADAEIANYPFTTIKPNTGVGYITVPCPCKKHGVCCKPKNSKCSDGIRQIPVRILDVAGLVPGAHEGKGLGNQFLGDLIQASGLIHVLDASGKTNSEGKATTEWDPQETVAMLEEEIDEWIRDISSKAFRKSEQAARVQKVPIEKLLAKQLSGLGISEEDIKGAMARADPESREFATILRKISKPILVSANKMDLPEAQENCARLSEKQDIVPTAADSELALKGAANRGLIEYIPGSDGFEIKGELNEKQRQALEFIKSNVLEKFGSTGVQECLNKLVFERLGYIAVYPVANIGKMSDTQGNVLPDVELVPKGTTVKELAYRIHSDLAEGFIGGLDLDRKKLGADHVLSDGDIVEILFKK